MSERVWTGGWTRCKLKATSRPYEEFESGARVPGVQLTQWPRTPQYKTKWPEQRDKLFGKRRRQSWKKTTDNTRFFDEKNLQVPFAGVLDEPVRHRKLWDVYPGGRTLMKGRTPRLPDSGPMSAPGTTFVASPRQASTLPAKVLPLGQLRPVADARLRNQPRIVSSPRSSTPPAAPQYLPDGSEMAVCASKGGTRLVCRIAPPPIEAVIEDALVDLYGGAQGTMNLMR
jgi:hypothetical protein